MKIDLQKLFHAERAKGEAEGLAFLIENFNDNPRFVRRVMARVVADGRCKALNDAAFEAHDAAAAAEEKAKLYAEFRRLSNRQKTKVGGFAGFVRRVLGSRWDSAPEVLSSRQTWDVSRPTGAGAASSGTRRSARTTAPLPKTSNVEQSA